jgi:hypothetical protein
VSALADARGCLTEAGFAALDKAPPGRGPAEAAAHLAACPRCQRRFLARGGKEVAGISARPGKAVAPPLWRTVALVLAVLILVAMALIGVRLLASR